MMGLTDFIRGRKEENSLIIESQKALGELDLRAKHDKKLRSDINARLTALQVELDNLTRRGGKSA